MHGFDHKVIFVKGQLKAVGAHHVFEGEKLSSEKLEIAYYKWIIGVIERLKSAIELVREAGIPWHVEHERQWTITSNTGRFAWETFGGKMVG
jgi:hypothetical protein